MSDQPGLAISADPGGLLRALSSRLGEALLVVDAGLRVRHVNTSARVMLEITGDPRGRRLEDVVTDYRLPLMARACLAEGQEVMRDLEDPGGARHSVAWAVPVGAEHDGGATEVALLIRDDSRLRRLETVRSDFVANVSHELRTPVAAIQLLVETLQGGAIDEPEVAGEFVGKIGLEVAHMAQIVAELLELSSIEAGTRPIIPVPTSVTELISAAERLRPLADERHIILRSEIAPATPPVMGDPSRLGQVVRNLVHNAIKFTPPGGTILLAARGIGDAQVEVRVVDSGCGMSTEEQTRVFERFYKADRSRQRDGEGTGLGLAIVRHVVEAHHGSIRIDSVPGRGSTFTVLLPAVRPG